MQIFESLIVFVICLMHLFIHSIFFGFSRLDRTKAVDILVKDLKVFSSFNEDLFKEITHLLTLDNFRYAGSLQRHVRFSP